MRLVATLSLLFILFATQLASADRGRSRHRRPDHRPRIAYPAPAAPAASTAGAIAYSPSTGQIGWAYGHLDQDAARYAAEQACGYADCRWQVSEQGMVAVLVLGGGGAPYVGWDHTLAAAQQRALELCSASTAGCRVVRWVQS